LAFAQFLGKKVLAAPKLGCFNIHTSLLPKYRGAAPIQYAILNGDDSSGVSIQKMVKKMDAGDIACQDEVTIAPTETTNQLYNRLKFQAALTLNKFVHIISEDKLELTSQNEDNISFAPTINKSDGKLDFENEDAIKSLNKIRAFSSWPSAFTFFQNKRMKVFEAYVENAPKKLDPGQVDHSNFTLRVGTSTDTLRLYKIQLEGKKKTTDSDLLRGMRLT
jgi:methionyl-tRNA formyltransferase